MTTDRAVLFFRLQCTLFCLFYGALLFCSVIYFRHRLSFFADSLGPSAALPDLLRFARFMHQPGILLIAALAPIALIVIVCVTRPSVFTLLAQAALMVLIVLLAFVPPVATEITTSAILTAIYSKAKERGFVH